MKKLLSELLNVAPLVGSVLLCCLLMVIALPLIVTVFVIVILLLLVCWAVGFPIRVTLSNTQVGHIRWLTFYPLPKDQGGTGK